jgi:hypothetical protein
MAAPEWVMKNVHHRSSGKPAAPRSGVITACSDAVSPQNQVSSTNSGRAVHSASTATMVTTSVRCSGRLKSADHVPRTMNQACSTR